MTDNAFDRIDQALRSGGPDAGFDVLAKQAREDKNYPLLFEIRLLKKRHELGLPLIQVDDTEPMPPETRREYDTAFIEGAREVGGLFLADGNIPRAWPYFRAIGEPAPIAAAIEKVELQEGMEPIIEIAYMERVHPYKGFEMMLNQYGICRAITNFGQFPRPRGPRPIAAAAGSHAARRPGRSPEARHHRSRRTGARHAKRLRADRRPRLDVRGRQLLRRHVARDLDHPLQPRSRRLGNIGAGRGDGRLWRRI